MTDDAVKVTLWRHTGSNVWEMAGEIANQQSLRFTPTFNEPGTWDAVIPYDEESAALMEPRVLTLIEFRGEGTTWRNVAQPSRDEDGATWLNVSGDGALALLGDVTAWRSVSVGLGTQPTPPTLYTGSAGQVCAALVRDNYGARLNLPLFVPQPAAINVGSPSRARASFTNLQELVVRKANAGGIGIDVGLVRTAATRARLELRAWVPEDRSADVHLSELVGTLKEWSTTIEPPTLTHAIVSGVEGTWSLVTTPASLADAARWGPREGLVSGPQSYDQPDLVQAGEEALAEGRSVTSMQLTATDTDGLAAFQDYRCGDKATATLEIGLNVVDVISSISVSVDEDGLPEVVPTFGNPDGNDHLMTLAQLIRSQDRRLRAQEQRG